MASRIQKALDSNHVRLVGMETAQESGWLVIDAFDVMIHLFLAATRERYGLERLWRDASEIPLTKVLPPAKPKTKAKSAKLRTAGARKTAARKRSDA